MELFQDIPQVIQAEIICHWLTQHEVAHLDSALCSKTIRPLFLSVLGGDCAFSDLDSGYEDQTDWVILRKIKVKELVLRNSTPASIRENLFRSVSSCLTEIRLCSDAGDEEDGTAVASVNIDDTFFDIALLCPMIQELAAWHVVASSSLNLIMLKCTKLQSLGLRYCTGIESKTIKTICSAPVLNCLDISGSQLKLDDADFSAYKSESIRELFVWKAKLSRAGKVTLLSCFPLLVEFSIGPLCGDDLVTIAGLCPHVKDTNITLDEALTEENAVVLCKQWPQIELLQVQREQRTDVVCSEQTMLVLLKGCPQLLKLSVCTLDSPHGEEHLYYSTSSGASASILSSSGTVLGGNIVSSNIAATSKVTDLFLESASEATLRVILSLCPQLNTLAVRHRLPFIHPRNATTNSQRAAEYALSSLNHPTCSVRKLHLHNIRSLAGVDLLSLTNLEELQLSNIGKTLGNETLLQVVKNNPKLRSISLYNCELLRGYSLILSLLKLCPGLHTLNFTECDILRAEDNSRSLLTAIAVIESMVRECYPTIKKVTIKL